MIYDRCFVLVYVIAWARGQLRINFTSIFKVFTKLPESRSDEGNLVNFENASEINPYCTRALAITCLSHARQNFVQRATFKVLRSRKQVCRLALKNRLVVARGKPAIIVSKKQQVQFIQSNFFSN